MSGSRVAPPGSCLSVPLDRCRRSRWRDTGRAMSQENVENVETVARLYNDCWGPGKLELVPEILHPDIVWTAIESAPDSVTRRGQVECPAYMNDWLESFDLKAMPIEEARGRTGRSARLCPPCGGRREAVGLRE